MYDRLAKSFFKAPIGGWNVVCFRQFMNNAFCTFGANIVHRWQAYLTQGLNDENKTMFSMKRNNNIFNERKTSWFSSELFPLRPLTRETNDSDEKGKDRERRNDKRKKKHLSQREKKKQLKTKLLSQRGLFSACFFVSPL